MASLGNYRVIVQNTTLVYSGAARIMGKFTPELDGTLTGMVLCEPTPNTWVMDLTAIWRKLPNIMISKGGETWMIVPPTGHPGCTENQVISVNY